MSDSPTGFEKRLLAAYVKALEEEAKASRDPNIYGEHRYVGLCRHCVANDRVRAARLATDTAKSQLEAATCESSGTGSCAAPLDTTGHPITGTSNTTANGGKDGKAPAVAAATDAGVGLLQVLDDPALLERLADAEHERWSGWMIYQETAAPVKRADWPRKATTKYGGLTEAEKESDRIEARKTLAIIRTALAAPVTAQAGCCSCCAMRQMFPKQYEELHKNIPDQWRANPEAAQGGAE